jgi:hypothetical protein
MHAPKMLAPRHKKLDRIHLHSDLLCAGISLSPLFQRPSWWKTRPIAQTIDLVEGIRPPLGGQWRSPLDDDKAGAGSLAIDCAREIRLTAKQRSTDRARAIIVVLMRPHAPPLVSLIVDLAHVMEPPIRISSTD